MLNAFFKEEGIKHKNSTARTPEQNGVVKRRNRTLVEAARTMLSASKLPLFFWAEAIATACCTQNRSIIILTHDKTAYHIINSNGYLVYNKRTRMIVESIHIRFNEIKEVSKTSVVNDTSGLVRQRQKVSDYDNPDPVPQLHNVSSSVDVHVSSQQELDLLLGPLYDEFFNAGSNPQGKQPTMNIQPTSAPSTPTYVHAEKNNNDQAEEEQSPDDEFKNLFCAPGIRKQVHRNPSRQLQTKRQLATDLEMCMFALTVSTAEPKNIKEAMANSAWKKRCRRNFISLTDFRIQLQDYGFNYNKIPLYYDSQSAIAISCNLVQHSRTKHIHTRYHFIKEQVENGIIELYFVTTKYQLADMFTKALPEDRFKYLVRRIGMRCLTPAELEFLAKESA
nr:retrovirus-related Pol polyprotein from transposon TNT 1-94 [Tanacetum cinerariifolium]